MLRKLPLALVGVLATVDPAHAGTFGGFGPGGTVLDDDARVCEPLTVGPDGRATGRPRCRAASADERATFTRPAAAEGWAASVKDRTLTVTRAGAKVVTWTAQGALDRVAGVHVGEGGAVAVEVKTRAGALLVPFRLAGAGAAVVPPAGGGPAPAARPPAAGLPAEIPAGRWVQTAIACERAAVTLDLTATTYKLLVETRCQSSKDRVAFGGQVRTGGRAPLELVLENDDGPEEAWPCAPKACDGGTCLACSDGEDGFELRRDPRFKPKKARR